MKSDLQQVSRFELVRFQIPTLSESVFTQLVDHFQSNLEREGGTGVYPPPTLHALLVSYLIHDNSSNNEGEDINTNANLVRFLYEQSIILYNGDQNTCAMSILYLMSSSINGTPKIWERIFAGAHLCNGISAVVI